MKISGYSLLAVLLLLAAGLYYLLQAGSHNAAALSTINVGVLPDENSEQLHAKFDPLFNYLSAETGLEIRLIESSDYDELVELFIGNKVDLAYLGGYTFVQCQIRHGAIPLVMRRVDTRFTSYFLSAAGNSAQDLKDFRGKTFSFGNRLSTSGHLMPRHFMWHHKEIVPEEFFEDVRYSGAHDATAYMIRDGDVELGVANSNIIDTMLADGRLLETDLRIVWETPPYADYVWAVQAHVPEETKTRLRNAFLGLDANDVDEQKILESLGARVFLPAGESDFESLRQVAESFHAFSRAR